jgi:hypothetical protein
MSNGPTYTHQIDAFAHVLNAQQHPWAVTFEADDIRLRGKLIDTLKTYTHLKFDHVKIGHLGRRIAVFVVRDGQSAVLYDKTRGFPSAKLMASLVLLGSP